MESVSVERLDHLGVVASVIKDLGVAACEGIGKSVRPGNAGQLGLEDTMPP
jgi:hypothetical protein